MRSKKQGGFIDLGSSRDLSFIMIMALVGLFSILGWIVFGVYWLVTHVRFV